MILLHDEQLLHSEEVDRVRPGIGQRRGTLYLTSNRIVFEEKANRAIFMIQSIRTVLNAPIEQVTNVMVDQRPFGIGRPVLHLELSNHEGFIFKTLFASDWAAWISNLRSSIHAPQEQRPGKQAPTQTRIAPDAVGTPVVVNVQAPHGTMPQSFLHCRYCGALTPAGTGPGAAKCSGCGAML